jgi:beta-phosphoglucomutase-like phosphatase (HAD superfamily)
MRVKEVLLACDHVLLAFDGPIAEMAPVSDLADRLRALLAGDRLPRKVARTRDPYVVLRHAAAIGPATEQAMYKHLCWIEHGIATAAVPAPGVDAALAEMAAGGTQLTVVSSLDPDAVRSFLVLHGFHQVKQIAGRRGPDPAVLPPAPDLVTKAVHERALESCVFVGSTAADLAAGRAAGVDTYRYRRDGSPWFEALTR